MKHLRAARAYFAGAFVVPPFVGLAAGADLAILFFVALLLAGAVCALGDPGGAP